MINQFVINTHVLRVVLQTVTRQCCWLASGLLIFFVVSCNFSDGTDLSVDELTASKVTISNPHMNYPYNYKGQNHVHSNRSSDGKNPPKDVFYAYRVKRYDYIALTDHSQPGYTDNCTTGLVCTHGTEVSQGKDISPDNHKLFFGSGSTYAAASFLDRIDLIEGANTGRIRDDIKNNITVLAHPSESWESFYNVLYPKMYILDQMYNGTEIGRGETGYVNFWDWAIPKRKAKHGVAMWGFASDDCHDINSKFFNRGWIMVNSQNSTPSAADIKNNILAGNFFSVARAVDDPLTPNVDERETVVQLGGSAGDGPPVTITVESGNLIHVVTDVYGMIDFIGQGGKLLQRDIDTKDTTYFVDGTEGYVRVVVRQMRPKLSYEGGTPELYAAHSQPLWVTLEGAPLPRPIPVSYMIPILMPMLF
jgi:hypothetical protein